MGDYQSATRFIPTQDEKDALKGTGGPPSRSNPFVVDDDPRIGGAGKGYLDILPQSLIPSQDGMEPPPYVSPTYGVITVFMDFAAGNDAQITRVMPPGYDGGMIRAKFFGTSAPGSGSGAVSMTLYACGIANGESYDTGWGGGAAVDFEVEEDAETISDWTELFNPAGDCAGGQRMVFKVVLSSTDILTFELTGVLVEYGVT